MSDLVMHPCPFCRARNSIVAEVKTSESSAWVVHCADCHAEGPPSKDRASAVKHFNHWVREKETQGVLEFASLDEILAELTSRGDTDALLLVELKLDDDGRELPPSVHTRGNFTTVLGLALRAAGLLRKIGSKVGKSSL